MKSKQIFLLFFVLSFTSKVFSDSGLKTSRLSFDEFMNKYSWNENVKEKIFNELKISEEEYFIINYENIYEISYMAYTPIILIFFEHQINLFSHEMYVLICTVDENKNLKHIDIQECESRKIEEIFLEIQK